MNKNKWLIYLAVGAVVVVIISLILRLITPTKQAPPTSILQQNLDSSSSEFSNIVYTGQAFVAPQSLPQLKAESTQTTEQYVVEQLISKYQLKPIENIDNAWIGSTYSLAKLVQQNQYDLTINQPPVSGIGEIDQTKAIKTAQEFINQLFPELELSVQNREITYWAGGFHLSQTSANKAEVVEIPFTYTAQGLPIFYQNQEDFPFKLLVNSNDVVQKLTFQPFFAKLTLGDKLATISLDQAVNNINNNQASIVKAQQVSDGLFSLASISSGELSGVSLEYRFDQQLGLAIPFYRFEGVLINNLSKEIQAEIITPAVSITKP